MEPAALLTFHQPKWLRWLRLTSEVEGSPTCHPKEKWNFYKHLPLCWHFSQRMGADSPCLVQSVVSDFVAPWTAACQASLSITRSQSLLKLMSIELVMPSNRIILCRPLLLLPSIFLSIRVFSNESALCIRWPKYWSFSFNISLSSEHPGLIFRMDWLDLL